MRLRETENPIGYKCCCCSFASLYDMDVIDRLKKIHNYPDEDATYSVMNLYR